MRQPEPLLVGAASYDASRETLHEFGIHPGRPATKVDCDVNDYPSR
ncbi:hypothetical protein ABZX93_03565 [Streptomyces sp. NPDC006632]